MKDKLAHFMAKLSIKFYVILFVILLVETLIIIKFF